MNALRTCYALCAIAGAAALAQENQALAAIEPDPAPAAVGPPRAGGEAGAKAKPSTQMSFHNLNMAVLSGFFPGWKEELDKFAGGNRARTWDRLARTAARDMIGAFGVGW